MHTPYAGEIPGTDAFIPYDRIVGNSELPARKDTEILLYCRSGRMSQIASAALLAAGYTNVVELDGGMDAWKVAGMAVWGETNLNQTGIFTAPSTWSWIRGTALQAWVESTRLARTERLRPVHRYSARTPRPTRGLPV